MLDLAAMAAHTRTHDWGAKPNCSFFYAKAKEKSGKTGFHDGTQGVKWFLMPDHSRQKQERIDRRTEAFTSRYRSVTVCKAFLGRDLQNETSGKRL